MDVVIIEDEPQAAAGLKQMLYEIDSSINVVAILESIEQAKDFFHTKNSARLIFSDIQLEDGLSFEIFEAIKPKCPIIFTTAYDQYAIEAFQTNGIGYLLKPINKEHLAKTLEKFEQLSPGISTENILALTQSLSRQKQYKSRFLIKIGERIRTVSIDEVIAFYSEEKATYLFTRDKQKYLLDHSLDYLETIIDPLLFFRINRKYILSVSTCSEIVSWSSNRLKIKVDGLETHDTVVARDRYAKFKDWLDR